MSHRILLIDDEDDILEFIRYNLTKAGYEVYIRPVTEPKVCNRPRHTGRT